MLSLLFCIQFLARTHCYDDIKVSQAWCPGFTMSSFPIIFTVRNWPVLGLLAVQQTDKKLTKRLIKSCM